MWHLLLEVCLIGQTTAGCCCNLWYVALHGRTSETLAAQSGPSWLPMTAVLPLVYSRSSVSWCWHDATDLSDWIELRVVLHTTDCMPLYCTFRAMWPVGQHGVATNKTIKAQAIVSDKSMHWLIVYTCALWIGIQQHTVLGTLVNVVRVGSCLPLRTWVSTYVEGMRQTSGQLLNLHIVLMPRKSPNPLSAQTVLMPRRLCGAPRPRAPWSTFSTASRQKVYFVTEGNPLSECATWWTKNWWRKLLTCNFEHVSIVVE